MHHQSFAEIIESSLHSWTAQSWRWDQFPRFGSLVMIETKKHTLFGMVYDIKTGSMDPMRYPFPYQKTEEELLREQPQIFEFLKTTFTCITLGYQAQGHIIYLLASEPPKIHSFVSLVPEELSKQFFHSDKYLPVLFGFTHAINNMDELLLAVLNNIASLGILHEEKLTTFMQTYSLLVGNDYRRIKLFLQRAAYILNVSKKVCSQNREELF